MPDFLSKYAGTIVAVLISCAGWAFNAGTYSKTIADHEKELTDAKAAIQRLEGFQETKWMVTQHERTINDHTLEIRKITIDIGDIKTDIKLIAEWVRQQREKHPNP